jgi:hypothetical protein
MRRPRLGSTLAALALLLLAAGLCVAVPRASAIDPFPFTGIQILSSQHFMVHYNRNDQDATCGDAITQEQAGEILGMFERAYSLYANWGYPPPVNDGDALVDVSVDDFAAGCVSYGGIAVPSPLDRWDALITDIAPLGAGDVHLDFDTAFSYRIIAHEFFHLVEDAMAPTADPWLQEGSAEWAAVRATVADGGTVDSAGGTLDCVGSQCGDTEAEKNGYPGWMLFEYLTERYHSDAKVKGVWDQATANPVVPATTDLAAVLDVSLATFYNDFANARLTGNFTFPPLKGALPLSAVAIVVGDSTGSIPTGNVAVNHLAARYLALKHGVEDGPCFEASLAINVAIPAGVESRPAYYSGSAGASAQTLTVSGSNASITVPWNTCADSPDASLSLPNDTLNLDGREFVVTGSVSVDLNKPATASAPPPGAHVIGTVITAPTTDPAPTLKIYAPEVLRVSTKTRLLRFVVFSSGDGKLAATLGSATLGSASLRSGNNDIRFVLPTQLFKSLGAKSASNVLALTSQSPTGAKGATFTRHVVVQAPPKPKKKKTAKKH